MDNKFWLEAEQSGEVCVGQQDRISAYVNGSGDIVIRQENPMEEGDSLVIVNPNNVKALISALKNTLKGA